MTEAWQTAGLIREAGGRLAGVQEELISPGLLSPVLALARRPEVWAGGLRDAFLAYFEDMDRFVRQRVAPGVEVVTVWLERRARELEEYERAAAAGTAWVVEPGPPSPLGDPGPGRPGPYVAPSGPVVGFTGCDPALVRQVASLCINAGAGAGALSARINTALIGVDGLVAPDAREATGPAALQEVSVSLLDAARDLQRRAETVEAGNALCGLFGGDEQVRKPYDNYVASLENEQWAAARSAADAAHSMAEAVVWDSMATAVLRRALSAPPDQRDQLLAGMGVQAMADDGTRLTGTAALRHAGLLDADGRFALPPLGTAEYERYKTWASNEAEAFASRVDTLAGPAQTEFTTCVAHHLDVEAKGKK